MRRERLSGRSRFAPAILFPKIEKILILGNRMGIIRVEVMNMKLIDRGMYLRKLIGVIGTPDIKVVTGVRRSGKSKLLEAFKEYVGVYKHHSAEFFLKLGAELAFGKSLCHRLTVFGEGGV